MLDLIDDDAAGENADWLADDVRPSMPLQPDGATEAGTPTIVPMTALSLKPVLRTDIPLIRDYPLPPLTSRTLHATAPADKSSSAGLSEITGICASNSWPSCDLTSIRSIFSASAGCASINNTDIKAGNGIFLQHPSLFHPWTLIVSDHCFLCLM